MKIKPLLDKVVIEELKPESVTKSGIVLPSSALEKPQLARVVAVGTGGVVDGKTIEMQVQEGDVVLYSQYAGNVFTLNNKEYKILKQSDILAVVEERSER